MNTTYEMIQTEFVWDHLREPPSDELARMDGRADFALCLYNRMMYLLDLELFVDLAKAQFRALRAADIQRYPFGMSKRADDGGSPEPYTLRAIHKTPPTARPQDWYMDFAYKAVEHVVPVSSQVNPFEVLSRMMSELSKERWAADRKRKEMELREAMAKKQEPPKSPEEKKAILERKKAIKKQKEDKATESVARGTAHGEFYIEGVRQKNPYKSNRRPQKYRMRHRKKKIVLNSMVLGGVFSEIREDTWREHFGARVGTQDRPPDDDENQDVPF